MTGEDARGPEPASADVDGLDTPRPPTAALPEPGGPLLPQEALREEPLSQEPPSQEIVPEVEWRRLSPRMLLVHPLTALRQAVPVLVGALVLGTTQSDDLWWLWILVPAVLAVVLGVLRWATTTFAVVDGRVQERHGLLQRETTTVPLDRVRSVDVSASLVHRVLGIATARVGTGVAGGTPLLLDGLTTGEAERLRHDLLASRRTRRPDPAGAGVLAQADGAVAGDGTEAAPVGGPEPVDPPAEEVLVGFDPRWVRYAPLTFTGVAVGAAVVGGAAQVVDDLVTDEQWQAVLDVAARYALAVVVAVLALGLVALVVGSAVVGYVLASWGHTVTRTGPDRLHVRRGLLTVRSTTLDLDRLRGVQLGQTLPLRLARAGTLQAVTTGLGGDAADQGTGSGSGSGLLPASPLAVSRRLGALLLGVDLLDVPLRPHGPGARRRRWTRALTGGALVLAPVVAAVVWQGWSWWWVLPGALPLLAAPALAVDRYRQLGHQVVSAPDGRLLLVVRSGSLHRTTAVLEVSGIIGWTVSQSFWQRRAGVATLTAASAAGDQEYAVVDLPAEDAWALLHQTYLR